MQTLLNVTKAKVCASIVLARSVFARVRGMRTAERRSCGMKAREPKWNVPGVGEAEER